MNTIPREPYQNLIAKILAAKKIKGVDPRHIEGFMRLQYHTLSHLSLADFKREVSIGIGCIEVGGVLAAEQNAQSFGL